MSGCTEGFATLLHIDRLMDNTELITRHSQFVLIPHIHFACNGTITKWIVGAKWKGNIPSYAELQIWRKNLSSTNTYTMVGSTPLMVGVRNSSNVYEYQLDTPLHFQEGDIFGYFLPHIMELIPYLEDSERLTTYYTLRTGHNSPTIIDKYNLYHSAESSYPVIAVKTGISLYIHIYPTSFNSNIIIYAFSRAFSLWVWLYVGGESICSTWHIRPQPKTRKYS